MGFEPTERSSRSSVFKTDALNQSLPTFHMAQVERIEHSYTVLETAVLPLNYTRLSISYFIIHWSILLNMIMSQNAKQFFIAIFFFYKNSGSVSCYT